MEIMVTKDSFCKIMYDIIRYHRILEEINEKLGEVGFTFNDDCPFYTNLTDMIQDFANLLELPEDDVIGNDLLWFIFETDCGLYNNKVEFKGKEYIIATVEDLFGLISGKLN